MKRRIPFKDEQRRICDAVEFVQALHRDIFITNRTSACIIDAINCILLRFNDSKFRIKELLDTLGYSSHKFFEMFKEQIRLQKQGTDPEERQKVEEQEDALYVTPRVCLRNTRLLAAIYMLGANVTPESTAEASGFMYAEDLNKALKKYTDYNVDMIYECFGPLANEPYNERAHWTGEHRRKLEAILETHFWDWSSMLNGKYIDGES